jgi:hypothetical protein
MPLRMMKRYDRHAARPQAWTAGLVGSAVGLLVMGAIWYIRSKAKARPQTPQALGWSRHIRLSSHPADRRQAEPL